MPADTPMTPIMPEMPSEDELKARLTDLEYAVTRCSGTEPPFNNAYWDCKDDGTYACKVCGVALFDSATKFDSGTGWPSFTEPTVQDKVTLVRDTSHGMIRVEVRCAHCDSHLGHVFPDGPGPNGTRYCINSASLHLHKRQD